MRRGNPRMRNVGLFAAAALLALALALVPARAGAAGGVTFSSTQTLPVPPASDYAGQGGGDGWGITLRGDAGAGHPAEVFNIFHHDSLLQVACHKQSNASDCYVAKSLDQQNLFFSGAGHSGAYLDPATSKLYAYTAGRSVVQGTDVYTAGVVCFDTLAADNGADPYCGFTPLSAAGDADHSTYYTLVSNPVQVGSRLFAFNFVTGAGVSGTKNTLLCFDLTTFAACSGQPFTVNLGLGESAASVTPPGPPIATDGTRIFVPINGNGSHIGCLDLTNSVPATCAGSWPVADTSGLTGSAGPPVPMLTPSGQPNGICLPS